MKNDAQVDVIIQLLTKVQKVRMMSVQKEYWRKLKKPSKTRIDPGLF